LSNVLSIKNLSLYYSENLVLKELNLEIKENEIVCIMGASGCGKSTFLKALNGFLEECGGRYEGEILFKGESIKTKDRIWLKRKMAMLFQDSKPFDLSIEKNLTYAMKFYEGKIKNKNERLKELLKSVNLYGEIGDNLKQPAKNLSGGQKQRLCIARMLTTSPEILIFDEPCSSLDMKNMLIIEELLLNLSKKYTIIIATHNLEQAKRLGGRIVRLG